MSGRRARAQRRAAIVEALETGLGVDAEIAAHMYDNQIRPQERVAEARADGLDVDVGLVNTTPGAEGYLVTCLGCGRTATLPYAPPAGKDKALCPDCQRGWRGRE